MIRRLIGPLSLLLSVALAGPAAGEDAVVAVAANFAEVAERVGYSSASTFSTAFSRHCGQPPSHLARAA